MRTIKWRISQTLKLPHMSHDGLHIEAKFNLGFYLNPTRVRI